MGLRQFLANRRMLMLLLGTAGTWFLFDYAYYGNTLSLPSILKEVDPHASLETKLAWTLALFVVFALPGYLLAVAKMDRIGHRRLQFIGFAVMAAAFLLLGAVPVLTTAVVPFLAIFGLSYFFIEFGPNTTTFVLPSEVFPVSMRTTGHGIAAGVGKLGAFIGVFVVPQLQKHIGLRGLLVVAGVSAVLGYLLTTVLPGTGPTDPRRRLRPPRRPPHPGRRLARLRPADRPDTDSQAGGHQDGPRSSGPSRHSGAISAADVEPGRRTPGLEPDSRPCSGARPAPTLRPHQKHSSVTEPDTHTPDSQEL